MQMMPSVQADHTALWFSDHKILCLADLHLGYDEELYRKGVHLPTNEWQYQRNLIGKLIAKYSPTVVVLNGDIKHGFSGINDREWRHTLQLFDLISERAKLIIIKGNHDNILEPIARKRNITIVDHYAADDLLFLHGDALPKNDLLKGIKTVIIGHEHPAISLTNGVRTETYKCFLKLPWNRRTLIVQPSTFSLNAGTDVMQEKFLSPFLTNLSRAEVYVVGEQGEVLEFGKLNRI